MEDDKIVEVYVESTALDETAPAQKSERIKSDYSRQIRFFGRLSRLFLSIGFPVFFTSLGAGLVFSILYSEQTNNTIRFAIMIAFWALAGLALIMILLGFLFRSAMRRYKKKDPNFEATVKVDSYYE